MYSQENKNQFIEALLENVERLDTVITDLNTVLQVKVEMETRKEAVVFDDLANVIKTSIENVIEKAKVQTLTDFEVPAINTVRYLYSIFYNLITNSIKYRKPGIVPNIEIRSESLNGIVIITFKDNGLGIDLVNKKEQVFGLYRLFHNHIEGKGMGLSLVKTQVELLGGNTTIESAINASTKFTMSFKENLKKNSEDKQKTALPGGR